MVRQHDVILQPKQGPGTATGVATGAEIPPEPGVKKQLLSVYLSKQ
jgi:hypothetical protein